MSAMGLASLRDDSWPEPKPKKTYIKKVDSAKASKELVLREKTPITVVFEVHIDPETNKITTSRFMCGRDRAMVQEVGDYIIKKLIERYNFKYNHLLIMSSDEADGIWVWVKSRVPIPPPALTTNENHHRGIEVNSVLRLNRGDDSVIDI